MRTHIYVDKMTRKILHFSYKNICKKNSKVQYLYKFSYKKGYDQE